MARVYQAMSGRGRSWYIALWFSPMIAISHSTGLSYRGYSEKRRTEKSYVMLRKPVAFSVASRCLQTV